MRDCCGILTSKNEKERLCIVQETYPTLSYGSGASDRRLALFENLFPIPRGVSYNSYLILDEKTALLDTTDASVTRQYLENVSHSLNGKPLDYLIINHMEPDHCANIAELLLRYPHLTLVGNAKTFAFVSQFYDLDLTGRTLTVKEGDTLCLGSPYPALLPRTDGALAGSHGYL